MKTVKIIFSNDYPALVPFTATRYKSQINPITWGQLGATSEGTKQALGAVYRVLTGKQPDPDSTVFSVKASGGAFGRFYSPLLCRGEGQTLKLQWGSEAILLEPKKGAIKSNLVGAEVELTFEKAQISGFEETLFKVTVYFEAEDILISVYFGIRLEDYKRSRDYTSDILNGYLKHNLGDLNKILGEAPQAGSSDPMIDLGQLEVGEEYAVIGYRAVKVGNRQTFILRLQGSEGQTYTEGDGSKVALGVVEVWANPPLLPFFGTSPKVSPDKPAALLVRSIREGAKGKRVDCGIIYDSPESIQVSDDDLDFSF